MTENSLSIVRSDGTQFTVEEVAGLTVSFAGHGSTVEIGEGSVFHNCKLFIGNEGRVQIGTTHPRGIRNSTINMGGKSVGKALTIGADTSIESCRFAMANEVGEEIIIGKGCMLSSNITFRTSDGHSIYDMTSKRLVNRTRPITVGDNVWIGSGATLTKGSRVPSNTVIATMALVSRRFEEENTAIGGNPAQVLKRNIGWSRTYVPKYIEPLPEDEPSQLEAVGASRWRRLELFRRR
ncbi:acetyltransferase-like isoleucine patch superfamily enzyme [Microbacterium sp. ZKA21]|uniref:acyltransferase n=1 Tax=Microbacterium sp. ZKA21 TaxID=3381694 RepID=UPI003D1C3220